MFAILFLLLSFAEAKAPWTHFDTMTGHSNESIEVYIQSEKVGHLKVKLDPENFEERRKLAFELEAVCYNAFTGDVRFVPHSWVKGIYKRPKTVFETEEVCASDYMLVDLWFQAWLL
jgi:hypothetical protein